jgi:hypothetical protein
MLIAICITLYIIIKNAIEAEKAKSAKIENDLKLEIDKMKSKLAVENATNVKLRFELESQQSIIIDLKAKLNAEYGINEKIRVDLENEKIVTIIKLNTWADLQLKIDNLLPIEVERKENVIKSLKVKIGMIMKRCSVCMRNEISVSLEPCGHTYCSSCLKTSYNCLKCKSLMRIHEI